MIIILKKILPKRILSFLKRIAFIYLKIGGPKYDFNVEPILLATIINELERLKTVKGNILEIGVARGMTTRFICEHLKLQSSNEDLLFAIDTFDSFTDDDLDFEVNERGKKLSDLREFEFINIESWSSYFKEFDFVNPIKSDCSILEYEKFAPVKLSLLDVDLYLPTLKTLQKLYRNTTDGGVIIVDDVKNNMTYDGAFQAYMEFCEEIGKKPNIVGNRCGLIYKNI